MDAKFCQADREISFDSTKIRGLFNEIAWRTFVKFSRDQRTKSGEFCFLFFIYSTVQLQEEECLIHADAFTSFIFCSLQIKRKLQRMLKTQETHIKGWKRVTRVQCL